MATVLVPLAQGCEELEAVTIIDILRRAEITVVTAGLDDKPVTASRGVVLVADTTLDDVLKQSFDMIILPGGLAGTDNLDRDPRIHKILQDMQQQGKYTAAICAAPKVLANAGLLENKSATSYPGILENASDTSVVTDGLIITSKGPATAMEFALKLIEILAGKDKRLQVAKGLLYEQ